ncbi:hypothetical protein GL267_008360 [Acidithiobacillus ferrianus]|uniref:Carboxymuconolactone decarboxylase-like domain-containing protein n=2 Tax=Acidithiobacillus ferrianus TaxID=2678518 RepID=A0A845ULQ9_9PROT|nr:hypothetical protein [Acidithiobacillus ferrianus]NDU42568.1 hypothetical protein [Acidithiobacillus ferrianus]
MALLNTVHPYEAEGKVAKFYQQIEGAVGYVPEAFQLFSVSPDLLDGQMATMAYTASHPTLSPTFIAMLRYLVSGKNRNTFCIGFNETALVNAGVNQEALRQSLIHPELIPLLEHDKTLMLFVLKAIEDPANISEKDIKVLHQAGWTDRDIYDALSAGAHHAATDVLFNAFKVSSSLNKSD